MPATTATPTILTDPGYLFWAPLSSTIPGGGTGGTVSGSLFTDSWIAPWVNLGATEDGSTFDYELNVEAISVAEFLDPIKYVTTARSGSFAFNLTSYTLTNLSKALNGSAPTIVSGTGATQLNRLRPPVAGAEVRCMIGWESLDSTMRFVAYQTINSGRVTTAYKKAPSYAVIPCTFNFEMPVSGIPFEYYSAGPNRA
jgi:hypothetical protein